MSKYEPLWRCIKNSEKEYVLLSFEEMSCILGFSIDHSFLRYKKELTEYGYAVKKIFMKERKVVFQKC